MGSVSVYGSFSVVGYIGCETGQINHWSPCRKRFFTLHDSPSPGPSHCF